jgi:hypothetical protein
VRVCACVCGGKGVDLLTPLALALKTC